MTDNQRKCTLCGIKTLNDMQFANKMCETSLLDIIVQLGNDKAFTLQSVKKKLDNAVTCRSCILDLVKANDVVEKVRTAFVPKPRKRKENDKTVTDAANETIISTNSFLMNENDMDVKPPIAKKSKGLDLTSRATNGKATPSQQKRRGRAPKNVATTLTTPIAVVPEPRKRKENNKAIIDAAYDTIISTYSFLMNENDRDVKSPIATKSKGLDLTNTATNGKATPSDQKTRGRALKTVVNTLTTPSAVIQSSTTPKDKDVGYETATTLLKYVQCQLCGIELKSHKKLNKHLLKAHDIHDEIEMNHEKSVDELTYINAEKEKIVCTLCGKKLKSLDKLQAHKEKHNRESL